MATTTKSRKEGGERDRSVHFASPVDESTDNEVVRQQAAHDYLPPPPLPLPHPLQPVPKDASPTLPVLHENRQQQNEHLEQPLYAIHSRDARQLDSERSAFSNASTMGSVRGRNRRPNWSSAGRTVKVVTGLKEAMNPKERRRREFRQGDSSQLVLSASAVLDSDTKREEQQYRIERTIKSDEEPVSTSSKGRFDVGGMLQRYIHWSLTTSMSALLMSLTAVFFAFTILFAVCIVALGYLQPHCIYVGDHDYEEAGLYPIDGYAISWTTFSTVGYGATGPAPHADRCISLNAFMAMEAFIGVLYAGFAGAVLFGKITRLNSTAHVLWSYPVVVRYGSGVAIENAESSNNIGSFGDDDDDESEANNMPCPVLEFRLLNSFHNKRKGGEITNASVTLWVSTLAEFASATVREAANLPKKRKFKKLKKSKRLVQKTLGKIGSATGKLGQSTAALSISMTGMVTAPLKSNSTSNLHDTSEQKSGEGTDGHPLSPKVTGLRKLKNAVAFQRRAKALARLGLRSDSKNSSEGSMDGSMNLSFDGDKLSVDSAEEKPPSPKMTIDEAMEEGRSQMIKKLKKIRSVRACAVTDDSSNGLEPQVIYSKLEVENETHPCFKRVWNIRHRLDEHSPLLSSKALEMIEANHGHWPAELNNHESVRKHLHFNEMIITFNGTDNATTNTVYAYKVYDFADVNIGWRFANMVTEDANTGVVKVDVELLNDVNEQHGGGAEPFRNVTSGDDGTRETGDIPPDETTQDEDPTKEA